MLINDSAIITIKLEKELTLSTKQQWLKLTKTMNRGKELLFAIRIDIHLYTFTILLSIVGEFTENLTYMEPKLLQTIRT